MSPAWSYTLAPFGLLGMYLAGKDKPYGWAVSIGTQVLWLAYSVSTHQWGFIIGTVSYAAMYVKNFLASKKRQEKKKERKACTCACHE